MFDLMVLLFCVDDVMVVIRTVLSSSCFWCQEVEISLLYQPGFNKISPLFQSRLINGIVLTLSPPLPGTPVCLVHRHFLVHRSASFTATSWYTGLPRSPPLPGRLQSEKLLTIFLISCCSYIPSAQKFAGHRCTQSNTVFRFHDHLTRLNSDFQPERHFWPDISEFTCILPCLSE
jgi:hypothetical protein